MARLKRVKLKDLADHQDDYVQNVVAALTLEWEKRVKEETPVDTGNLRNGWEGRIGKYEGEITNRVEYAEPVCYGSNLPPSWKNASPPGWRTKTPSPTGNALGKKTREQFPDLIGKELEGWAERALSDR